MSTKIPTNGHKLDATTVAAMITKAEADGSAESWRALALMMADAVPAPKKAKKAKAGKGEYARVHVTFADGVSHVVGTYERTKAGEVDLAAAERGAVWFRKAAAWEAARLALGPNLFAHSGAPGHTWVRSGGRWRLVPPPVEIPAVVSSVVMSAEEIREHRRAKGLTDVAPGIALPVDSQAPAFSAPLRMSRRMRDAVAAFIGHKGETAAPQFGAKVAIPVRCQDHDDDAGALDFSAAFGSVDAFAAMQAEDVA